MVRNVFLIALTYQIMLNATRPIVSLYAVELGASTAMVGTLAAVYAFFPLLVAVRIGKLTDRFGIRLPVVTGTIGLTIALAFPWLFPSLWSLYVSQALVGVAQIFINVALQNAMGMAADKTGRDKNFSIFSLGISSGSLIGPVVGGYLGEYLNYAMTFLAATLFGVVPILLSFFLPGLLGSRKKEQQDKGGEKFRTIELLKLPILRRALASSMLVLYSRDIYMTYFPLFAASIGLSSGDIGLILTIQGGASVAVRGALAWMTGKWGRENVLFYSLLIAGLSFFCVPFFDLKYWYWGLAVLLGFGLGCGQPLSMSITYNASPEGRTGEALGLRLSFNRLSQVIAPLVFGAIGTFTGLPGVFYTSGLFLIGGSFLTARVKTKGGHAYGPNEN